MNSDVLNSLKELGIQVEPSHRLLQSEISWIQMPSGPQGPRRKKWPRYCDKLAREKQIRAFGQVVHILPKLDQGAAGQTVQSRLA